MICIPHCEQYPERDQDRHCSVDVSPVEILGRTEADKIVYEIQSGAANFPLAYVLFPERFWRVDLSTRWIKPLDSFAPLQLRKCPPLDGIRLGFVEKVVSGKYRSPQTRNPSEELSDVLKVHVRDGGL